MVSLPEPVARMIKHPSTYKVLSTVSPTGEPHSIVCGSLMVADDNETIIVGEVYMYRAAENLDRDPRAEFLVWKGKDAYSIKAVQTGRHTSGHIFERMEHALGKMNMTVVAVRTFRVEEVWDESAGHNAGKRVV